MALRTAKKMDSLYQNMSKEQQRSVKHKENLDATKLMKSPPGSSKDKEQDAMKKASSIQNKLQKQEKNTPPSNAAHTWVKGVIKSKSNETHR